MSGKRLVAAAGTTIRHRAMQQINHALERIETVPVTPGTRWTLTAACEELEIALDMLAEPEVGNDLGRG